MTNKTTLTERAFTVRAINADRSMDIVASVETIDAHGTIIDLASMRLERFLKNPVFLDNHAAWDNPVGRVENLRIEGDELLGTVVFAAADVNPRGEELYRLYKADMQRAVSIRFRGETTEVVEDGEGRRYERLRNAELVEISAVVIGSNPDTVSTAVRAAREGGTSTSTEDEKMADETIATLSRNIDEARQEIGSLKATMAQERTASETKVRALDDRCKELETQRAAQQKRADDLEGAQLERELDELVGTRIALTEKPGLLKLAMADRAIYDAHIEAIRSRPATGPVRDTGTGSVLGAVPDAVGQAGAPEDLSVHIERAQRQLEGGAR